MARIFTFYGGPNDGDFYPSLRACRKAAKAALAEAEPGTAIDIEQIETGPLTKSLLLAVINSRGGSFAERSAIVETIRNAKEPR